MTRTAPDLLKLEDLDVETDAPGFTDAELEVLAVVERLTAGVEGAWCSGRAVWLELKKLGHKDFSKAALRSLTNDGLLLVGNASWPSDEFNRPYSRRRMVIWPGLLAMTRECKDRALLPTARLVTHRWGLLDVQLWRRLADVSVWCADDMERRGEVRGKRIADLRVAVKRAYKAKFPAPEADWPRFSLFLRLAEEFTDAGEAWRKAWTAALDTSARAILARLDRHDPPPAPSSAAAQAAGGRPWWTDGK